MADIKFKLGFDLDKKGIEEAKRAIGSLVQEIDKAGSNNGMTRELENAKGAAQVLDSALKKAYNNDFEKLNLKAFNRELKKSGYDLNTLNATLRRAGVDGSQAFREIEREMLKVGYSIKKSNKLLDDMFDTLGKTVKWNLASGAVNKIQGSLQQAVGFTKSLDNSLNQIRIVSGKSADEMKVFAEEANSAAKALGKTTTEYADASLLFFQQGKSAAEVKELTEATLMGANITGTEVSAMADMITSALNGYSMAADKAVYVTDTLAAVGAATGADFEELAVGMSKVASQAATVNVPFEKLNAMLATISETTREAPETIGTSLKTVFARMSEIKLTGSATDEEGVTMSLGKVQDALSLIDVSLVDNNNNMRDMGTVIEEIGGKWEGLNVETKSAITNAMAGQRQASRLMALFNQWERYEVALDSAMNATGATMEQNEVRMDSLSYKTQQMRAELEKTWMNLLDEEVLKDGTDMLTSVLEKLNSFIEMIGGAEGVIRALGGVALMVFSKQIAGGLDSTLKKMKGFSENRTKTKTLNSLNKSMSQDIAEAEAKGPSGKAEIADIKARKQELELSTKEYKYRGLISEEEKEILNTKKAQLIETNKAKQEAIKQEERARKIAADADLANKHELDNARKVLALEVERDQELSQITRKMIEISKLEDNGMDAHEKMEQYLQNEAKSLGISEEILEEMVIKFDAITDSLSEDEWIGGAAQDKLQKELDETNEKIVRQLELQDELLEVENAGILDGGPLRSEQLDMEAQAISDEAQGIFKNKKFEALTQGVVKWGGVALSVAATAGPALKTMFDETATNSEKVEAGFEGATAAASTLGFALGGPLGAAVGGLAVQIGKLIYENTGLQKVFRENAKAIETFESSTRALKDELSDLASTQKKLAEVEQLAASGIDNTNREQYVSLQNDIAELAPQLIRYYDSEGNAVVDLTKNISALTEAKREQLRVTNQQMANRGGSLGLEYGKLSSEGEGALDSLNKSIAKTQEQIQKTTNPKDLDALNEKLLSLQEKLAKTTDELVNIQSNVQKYMVQPFLEGDETLSQLSGGLKEFSANIFDVDTALRASETGYQLYKMTKDSSYLEKALKDAKAPAKEIGEAMYQIQYQAKNGDKNSKELLGKLEKMQPAAKKLISTLSQGLDLDSTAIQQVTNDLAKVMDKTGFIDITKIQGTMDQLMKAKEEQFKREIDGLEKVREANKKEVESLNDKSKSFEMAKKSATEYYDELIEKQNYQINVENDKRTGLFNITSRESVIENLEKTKQATLSTISQEQQAGTQDFGTSTSAWADRERSQEEKRLKQEALDIEKEIVTVKEEQANISAQQKEYQLLINDAMNDYLFDVADTVEGYNMLLSKYNELNEAQQSFFDSLDSAKDEGGFFFGVEEELENIRAGLEEGSDEWNKLGEDYSKQFVSAFETLPDNMKSQFEQVAGAASGSIDKLVKDAKAGSKDAQKSLSDIAKAQAKETGKIYAALNKDNTQYFSDFKKANKDQLTTVSNTTGIMAEDYSTLAEYKVALDQWQAETKDIFNGKEAESTYLWAQEALGAVRDADGDGIISAEEAMKARANASKAASWAAVLAQAEAEKEKNSLMVQGMQALVDSFNAGDSSISKAAADAATQEIAKIQAHVAGIDAIIADAKSKIAGVVEAAGGDSSTMPKDTTGTPPKNNGLGNIELDFGTGTKPPPKVPTGNNNNNNENGGGLTDGKGGKDDKEKEVEDLEWEEDIYHDINIQLEQKQQLLDKLQRQQDKLYGQELLDNLAKQKQLLKEQQALLEKKLEMQKKDLENQKEALSKQGVQFNVDGTIANYNELLKQKVAYVNSLSGEAKEAAKEEFESLVEMMEKYEDLLINGVNEMENAIQDSIDAQREIFIQEFEYTIKVQIELSEDFQKAVDFQKEMADSFEDYSENYSRTMEQLAQKLGEVSSIQEHLNKIQNDTSLTDKERIEMLSEYSEKMKEAVKDAKKLREEMTKLVEDALKDGLDIIKEQLDGYKAIDNQIKHIQQMVKLLGKEGDFEFLGELYQSQYENVQGQLDLLLAQKKSLQAQRDSFEKGSDEWKIFNAQLTSTEDQINKLTQESLKILQDQFKNTINGIMEDLDKALSKGIGLSELKDDYKDLKDQRKEYLDIEEKITEVGKLQKKIQDAMKNTTDPKQLAALQKFREKELAQLKEKDKLTKYDLDRANLLYELTLKQIALDEQRNAKNMMKLVRDAQGNWVYEFVEDSEAVEKAQQELSDILEKLQELDKKQFEKTQEDMLKAKEDYVKQIQDIINKQMKGEYATDEEFKAALEEAQKKFNERAQELSDRLNEAQTNGTLTSLATMLQAYYENDEALSMLSEHEEAMMKQLADAIGGDFTQLSELMALLNSGNLEDFNAMAEGMGIKGEDLKSALESITGQIKEDWGGNISDMIGDVEGLGDFTGKTVEDILNAWNDYKGKVEETTDKTGDSLEGLKDKLGDVSDATDELSEKTDALIGRFDEEMNQIAEVVRIYNTLRDAYNDNIKKATEYINKLDELIRKQKEQATGVATPTPPTPPPSTGGSGSGSGSGSSGSGGSGSSGSDSSSGSSKPPKKGGQVKVKNSNAAAWYDSSNSRPVPDWNSQARAAGVPWDATMWAVNTGNGKMALSKTNNINGALAWVKESDLVGLRTGGYTGAFDNPQQGKLAMLHEKELVLNKEDTKNMLDTVKQVRGIGSDSLGAALRVSVEKATQRIVSAIGGIGSGIMNSSKIGSVENRASETIEQSVSINADFSGVKSANEIEKAFDNLAIQASQYAMKKR